MAKQMQSHYVGEKAADQQQAAVTAAKTAKVANERGEGNSLNNNEVIEIPTNLDQILWLRPWKLDNGTTGNAVMLDLETTTGRKIAISANYLFQPVRINNGYEKGQLPTSHPMVNVAKRFRYAYDLWSFISWVGINNPSAAIQVVVAPLARYEWGKDAPEEKDYRGCQIINLPAGITLEALLTTWQSQNLAVSLRPA